MTRRPTPRLVGAATFACALLATAGCSGSSKAAPATAPAPTSPTAAAQSPTPTPSATPSATAPLNSEDRAIAYAEQAIRDFFAVTDRIGAQPTDPDSLKPLSDVAVGEGLNDARNVLIAYRNERLHNIGQTQVVALTANDVDLAYRPKRRPPDIPTVQMDVCYDVSKVNVVDEDGKSVVEPERQGRAVGRFWVSNHNWPDSDGWRVSATDFSEERPC